MSDMRKGQKILIWGAERPTASLLAQRYLDQGAADVAILLDERGVDKNMPAEVRRIDCDPANPRQMRAFGKELAEDKHGLDVLAIIHDETRLGYLSDNSLDDWQQSLKHNLHLVLQLSQLAYPALKLAKGNVALLGSIGGPYAYTGFGPTGVVREATHTMSRYMASEWIKDGIRVNTVAIAVIAEGETEHNELRLLRARSLPRPDGLFPGHAHPEEIVDIFDFITSPKARWLTGQILMADGGMSLGLNFDHFLEQTNFT